MRPRLILTGILAAALVAAPASAASPEGEAKKPEGQYVDLSPAGLPIVHQGRLINYVFVTVRLMLARSANATALREKEPYFRDALVRAAHRRPFTRLDDFTHIDEAALRATLGPEVARIAGRGQVIGMVVTQQTPQRRSGLPRPPQAARGRPPAAPAQH